MKRDGVTTSRSAAGILIVALLGVVLMPVCALSATSEAVQARVTRDVATGHPIVVHAIVALCDNAHQGIVPVPAALGDGQEPRTNLYWGARYGLATWCPRDGGWRRLPTAQPSDSRILQRQLFTKRVMRKGHPVEILLVADAWDGAHMAGALARFFDETAGNSPESVRLGDAVSGRGIAAGGAAQAVVFVGHNGLMDAPLASIPDRAPQAAPSASMVLACMSREYFQDGLRRTGSRGVLLTTGLMAPEAYTLDAALTTWASGATDEEVCVAAAAAYARYQRCRPAAARALFRSALP